MQGFLETTYLQGVKGANQRSYPSKQGPATLVILGLCSLMQAAQRGNRVIVKVSIGKAGTALYKILWTEQRSLISHASYGLRKGSLLTVDRIAAADNRQPTKDQAGNEPGQQICTRGPPVLVFCQQSDLPLTHSSSPARPIPSLLQLPWRLISVVDPSPPRALVESLRFPDNGGTNWAAVWTNEAIVCYFCDHNADLDGEFQTSRRPRTNTIASTLLVLTGRCRCLIPPCKNGPTISPS